MATLSKQAQKILGTSPGPEGDTKAGFPSARAAEAQNFQDAYDRLMAMPRYTTTNSTNTTLTNSGTTPTLPLYDKNVEIRPEDLAKHVRTLTEAYVSLNQLYSQVHQQYYAAGRAWNEEIGRVEQRLISRLHLIELQLVDMTEKLEKQSAEAREMIEDQQEAIDELTKRHETEQSKALGLIEKLAQRVDLLDADVIALEKQG